MTESYSSNSDSAGGGSSGGGVSDQDRARYNDLVNEKKQNEAQQRTTQKEIGDLDSKIERLELAYKKIGYAKYLAEELQRADNNQKKNKRQWRGDTKTEYDAEMEALLSGDKKYHKKVDGAQDAVNREITRLKNIRDEKYGFLGWLSSRARDLGTMIQNFFN